MNQGGNIQKIVPFDSNSVENRYVADAKQVQASQYLSSTNDSYNASWTTHSVDSRSTENDNLSSSIYHPEQPTEPVTVNIQDGSNVTLLPNSSTLGMTNVGHNYNGYVSYPNSTDQYAYGANGYQNYYNGYQNQSNHSYSQPTPPYQNTGGSYQPPSSVQNSGSYAAPTSTSGSYQNPAHYQTAGGYPGSGGYDNETTTAWNQGNYVNYNSTSYPNYTPETTYSSTTTPASSLHYQQQYNQWPNHSQTEVTCAPGTEKLNAPDSRSNYSGVVANGTLNIHSQPAPAFVQSWNMDSSSSQTYTQQPVEAASGANNNYWQSDAPTSESHSVSQIQQHYQDPSDPKQPCDNSQESNSQYSSAYQVPPAYHQPAAYQVPHTYTQPAAHQVPPAYSQSATYKAPPSYSQSTAYQASPAYSQSATYQAPPSYSQSTAYQAPPSYSQSTAYQAPPSYSQSTAYQVPPSYSQSAASQVPPSYSQPAPTMPSLDAHGVSNLQVPTNLRITSNVPKTDKDRYAVNVAANKPIYIDVSMPKPNDDSADSILKSGMFPKSLRGYVERAFARCEDEKQKASCQAALKEIITRATSEGTLNTRNWDTEPLLPVLQAKMVTNDSQSSKAVSFLAKRSPTRRTKSRWEPLLDQKPVEKFPAFGSAAVKYGGWAHQNENDKKALANTETKVEGLRNFMSPLSEQKPASSNVQQRFKRQRFTNGVNDATEDDVSSNSDEEQKLTAYYSSAIALANSADEKKRREHRSKRFEKRKGTSRDSNFLQSKNSSAGNTYTRRPNTLVVEKTVEDAYSTSRAVEDIDWDSLTVKGTCQEIEKRYLRLTSAPDPSTVRPEEVLEKALTMIQNSEKNYLYKCDQLKSVRQDLTVQRINNQLTVKVYETHARLALEVGDLPEYNQCQSQLKFLYSDGIEGCHMEFSAYNLLCVILHSNNNRDLLSSMSRLSDKTKKDKAVRHALAVRAAVSSGNYVSFFRLYKTAPNLNTCLMDLYVEKMRYKAVTCMSRAYRPNIPVSYIGQVLGFTNEEKGGEVPEECVEWLKAHGACLVEDNSGEMQLDAKASASSLYMPEPEDAVPHGDANLAVNDFFTRSLS